MIVLYTDSFDAEMKKYRGKQRIDLEDFFDRIVQRLLADPLYLCRPYIKLKLSYRQHSIRIVVRFDEDKQVIIPLFITDKTNKQHGSNMIRDQELQQLIFHRMSLATYDLNNDHVKILRSI